MRQNPVALRKESVDRNSIEPASLTVSTTSLSARRAWIEMFSVREVFANFESLSARRAWIEIDIPPNLDADHAVALRKESVDRNLWWGVRKAVGSLSLSARRAWIEMQCSD